MRYNFRLQHAVASGSHSLSCTCYGFGLCLQQPPELVSLHSHATVRRYIYSTLARTHPRRSRSETRLFGKINQVGSLTGPHQGIALDVREPNSALLGPPPLWARLLAVHYCYGINVYKGRFKFPRPKRLFDKTILAPYPRKARCKYAFINH